MKTIAKPKRSTLIGRYYGTIEYLDSAHIRGWCIRSDVPEKALTLKIYLCGILVGTTICNIPRPDFGKVFDTASLGGFHFSWAQSKKKSLRRALAKLRKVGWDRDATKFVKARINGTFYSVSSEHLGHFCPSLTVGHLYASLAWLSSTADEPLAAPGGTTAAASDKPILIVIHDTFKYGAQLFIVRFAEWLKINAPEIRMEFLFATPRPSKEPDDRDADALVPRLDRLGPVYYLDGARCPENLSKLNQGAYRLLYLNSLASLYNLGRIPAGNIPMLIHAHELQWAANYFLADKGIRQRLSEGSAHFVACSSAVRDMLIADLSLASNRVSLVHSFVPTPDRRHEPTSRPASPVQSNGVATILIVGTLSWRKGGYLLGALASSLNAHFGIQPNFLWVGEIFDKNCESALKHEFFQLGLSSNLSFAGHQESMAEHYGQADILLLPSIEDPFPQVMIEAGMARLPIVAFDGSGGASEFIALNGGGIVVPHLDVQCMAQVVAKILSDPHLRESLGARAYKTAEQFTDSVQAPNLLRVIKHVAESASPQHDK